MSTAASSRMGARRSRRSTDLDHEGGLTEMHGVVQATLPEGSKDHPLDVIRQATNRSSSSTVMSRKPLQPEQQQTVKPAHSGSADRVGVRRPSKQHLVRDPKHGDGDRRIVVVGERATGSVRVEQATGYNPARREVLNCSLKYGTRVS